MEREKEAEVTNLLGSPAKMQDRSRRGIPPREKLLGEAEHSTTIIKTELKHW